VLERYSLQHQLTCLGAVGVALCILGLELPFPVSSPHLTLATLFHHDHIPLLAASILPSVFLCVTVRLEVLVIGSTSWTQHPLYMPLFCVGTAIVFWIVATLCDVDMESLLDNGWLFVTRAQLSTTSAGWNYWALFDLERIRWNELLAVSGDLALLVAIATLSLPIFVLTTVTELKVVKDNMNYEFLGHGIANVFAGFGGTLPALMVLDDTLYIDIANIK
jgi:MFS superfamily sulfate permease-like transporter